MADIGLITQWNRFYFRPLAAHHAFFNDEANDEAQENYQKIFLPSLFGEKMQHSFNIELANVLSVDEAILLQNLTFWQLTNKANGRNFHDGKYWSYNSTRAFAEIFPYWSQQKIKRILKSLEEAKMVTSGNFNKSAYDRTKWYSVCDYALNIIDPSHCTEMNNGKCENVQPIPDINTDSKPDNKNIYKSLPIEQREEEFKALVKTTWSELGAEDFLPNLEAQKFYLYWSESNGKKMLWERQKTFDIKKRFKRWQLNNFNSSKPHNPNIKPNA